MDSGNTAVNNGAFNVSDGDNLAMTSGSNFSNGAGGALGVVADASANAGYGITGTGANTLAGTLNVATVGTPATGAVFSVVTGSSRTGKFTTVNTGSTFYSVIYTSTGVNLKH
jgi:hypothetical protein